MFVSDKLFQGFIFIYLFICMSVCVCVHLSIHQSFCMYIKAIGAPGVGVPDVNGGWESNGVL